jgi:hypothetical protein
MFSFFKSKPKKIDTTVNISEQDTTEKTNSQSIDILSNLSTMYNDELRTRLKLENLNLDNNEELQNFNVEEMLKVFFEKYLKNWK